MIIKKLALLLSTTLLFSCATYNYNEKNNINTKKYFSSKGFVLIYEDKLFIEKIINKKINNNEFQIIHNKLKPRTPVKVINPENSKFVITYIYKNATYPKIFDAVISSKIASALQLDLNNPYIEIIEIKKNKTFVAKKSSIFDEEKNVAEKAPVNEVVMDVISSNNLKDTNKNLSPKIFLIGVNDFYYKDSAVNLKNEIIKKTKIKNIYIKKINNTKYRLLIGPFKSFNTLKNSYISLNDLGFEDLIIYKE